MPAISLLTAVLFAVALPPASNSGIAGKPAPEPRPVPVYRPATNTEAKVIRNDIRDGREQGELTRREARHLRRELREIGMLEDRYASGGLSDAERAELRARIEVLRALTRGKRLGTLN